MLLLTVGYGAASLAGQDEDGSLCLLATLPIRRSAIVAQKVLAMALPVPAAEHRHGHALRPLSRHRSLRPLGELAILGAYAVAALVAGGVLLVRRDT